MPKTTESDYVPLYQFWQPRFWLLWIGLGILRLMVMLPFRIQWQLGRLLGRLLFFIVPKRRRIAEINLRICFPELDEIALRQLLIAHGESIGFSVFEIGLALWAGQTRIEKLVSLEGLENLTTPTQTRSGCHRVKRSLPRH